MLGETFEYIDKQFGTKVIVEQVSHHPPISAFYCENEHFVVEGWFGIKTVFQMSGLFVDQLGDTFITLKSTGERFKVTRPRVSVHNIIMGELFVWTEGQAVCENLDTGHKAEMSLPSIGLFKKKEA